MMRQMPRAQPRLNRTRWRREMYPVVHELIDRESGDDSEQKDHPGRPEDRHKTINTTAVGMYARIANTARGSTMMLVVERRHERPMRMREHAVNDVFDERPREQSRDENERGEDHIAILGWRQWLSNAAIRLHVSAPSALS